MRWECLLDVKRIIVCFRILFAQALGPLGLARSIIWLTQRSVGLRQCISSLQIPRTQTKGFAQMLDGSFIVPLVVVNAAGEGFDQSSCRWIRIWI